jgi:hypothetical protein
MLVVTVLEGWEFLEMGPSGSDDAAGDDGGEAGGKEASLCLAFEVPEVEG